MTIQKHAIAGTMESSDCFVTVAPGETEGVIYEIQSVVRERYGDAIVKAARETVDSFDVTRGIVTIRDFGALDCVIAARVEAALRRSFVKEEGK